MSNVFSAARLAEILPAFTPALRHEVALLAAALVTLLGAWICWHAPRRQMSIEEHAKDGDITAEQARMKMRISAIAGPIVTILGLGMIAWVLLS